MGQDIFVREQGAIIFNLSNTLNIATPIEGDQTNGPNTSGGLQKIGDGVLNLNGANTYSGQTTVDGGTLKLNGSVRGNIVVGSGGTLSGNATIGGAVNSSGAIHTDINSSGGTSLVTVTGAATLAGTLEIALNSNAPLQTYTVLTSSAITGTFNAVTFTGKTPVNYSVSYQPTRGQFGRSNDKTGAFGYNADNDKWDYNEAGFNAGAEFGYSYPWHRLVIGPEILMIGLVKL